MGKRYALQDRIIPRDTVLLLDIQKDSDLKRAFSEQDLLSFDSGNDSSNSYHNLSQDDKNFTALF